MPTNTSPKASASNGAHLSARRSCSDNPGFDPDEIRRLVALGKQRGLIHDAGAPVPITKNGEHAAKLLHPMGKVLSSQWIDVTPAMAATWLENNFKNRPLSKDVVEAYARDMVNGEWVPTHQGIAFNDEDALIDGQHRLHAIVRSGQTVRMMVTFGLPSKIAGKEMTTMDAVDRGRTRSVADQLKIQHGMRAGLAISAICAAIGGLCLGERTRRLSVGQTLAVHRAFEPAILHVIAHRSKQPGLRAAGVLAGFAFALATEADFTDSETYRAGCGTGTISRMFELLVDGEDLKPNSPIAHLRAFLTSDESKLFTPTLNRGLAELALQAIFLELKKKPIPKLEMGLEGIAHFKALQAERVEQIAALFRLPKHEA